MKPFKKHKIAEDGVKFSILVKEGKGNEIGQIPRTENKTTRAVRILSRFSHIRLWESTWKYLGSCSVLEKQY